MIAINSAILHNFVEEWLNLSNITYYISNYAIDQLLMQLFSISPSTAIQYFGSGRARRSASDWLTLHASWTFGFLKIAYQGQRRAANAETTPLADRKIISLRKYDIQVLKNYS